MACNPASHQDPHSIKRKGKNMAVMFLTCNVEKHTTKSITKHDHESPRLINCRLMAGGIQN